MMQLSNHLSSSLYSIAVVTIREKRDEILPNGPSGYMHDHSLSQSVFPFSYEL